MINQTLDKMTGMRLRDMAAEYRRQTELPAMKDLPFEERFSLMVEADGYGACFLTPGPLRIDTRAALF
jgi:hypothetical protein